MYSRHHALVGTGSVRGTSGSYTVRRGEDRYTTPDSRAVGPLGLLGRKSRSADTVQWQLRALRDSSIEPTRCSAGPIPTPSRGAFSVLQGSAPAGSGIVGDGGCGPSSASSTSTCAAALPPPKHQRAAPPPARQPSALAVQPALEVLHQSKPELEALARQQVSSMRAVMQGSLLVDLLNLAREALVHWRAVCLLAEA